MPVRILKKAHQDQDLAGIDAGLEALNKAWEGASQEMYAASQGEADGAGGQPGPDAEAGSADGDNVSDVEFEEVEEDDKK